MKKIRKSNIAGEILFLLGIIILWQIFYVAGVDGLGIWKAYAMPSPVGVWNSFVEMMTQGNEAFLQYRGFEVSSVYSSPTYILCYTKYSLRKQRG